MRLAVEHRVEPASRRRLERQVTTAGSRRNAHLHVFAREGNGEVRLALANHVGQQLRVVKLASVARAEIQVRGTGVALSAAFEQKATKRRDTGAAGEHRDGP